MGSAKEIELLTKAEILALEDELFDAIKSAKIEAPDKFLHDDLLFVIPNGSTITKTMDLDSHSKGEIRVEKLERSYEETAITGDVATITSRVVTTGKMLGEDISGPYKYIRCRKLCSGPPKIISGSCMRIS